APALVRAGRVAGAADQELAVGLAGQGVGKIVSRELAAVTDALEVREDLALAAKSLVELSRRREADQAEVSALRRVGEASHDNLAVRLDQDILGLVVERPEAGRDLAVAAERGVQAAVGVVSDHGELVVRTAAPQGKIRPPGDDDPAATTDG